MDRSVVIRPARRADASTLVRLVRGLAAFESLPAPDDGAEERLVADGFGERPRFDVLLAEREDRVCGYALFFHTYSTFLARPSLWLEDLFVEPAWRGRGIGTAMMHALARTAVARGCGRLEWSVLDWNERAQRFYASLGADVHREWWICRVEGEALSRLGAGGGDAAPVPRETAAARARMAVLERHLRAENDHDLDAIVATFTPEAELVLNGASFEGHDLIRVVHDRFGFGDRGGFTELRVRERRRHVGEQSIVLEQTLSGRHSGSWEGLAPTGRTFEIPACTVYSFADDGRLAGEVVYFDRALLLRQLGLG